MIGWKQKSVKKGNLRLFKLMKRKWALISLILLVMAGLAMADELQSQDGTTVLYDNINGAGPRLQDTGNTIQLYNAVGDALGPKTTDAGGTITFIPGLFGLFGGGTKIDTAPWGTVPLYISRDGENIKITWEATKAPGAQIYVLTGDGSGKFQKNDPAAWKLYTDSTIAGQFNAGSVATGVLYHNKQVGSVVPSGFSNHGEAFYFGLQAGVTPQTICTDPDPLYNGKPCFAVAPAVGKVNMSLAVGYNLVSLPFTYNTGGDALVNVFGQQLTKQDSPINADEIYYKQDSASWGMTNAFQKTNGSWYLSSSVNTPAAFTVGRDKGYLVSIKANSAKITAVGNVSQSNQIIVMKTGFNAVGVVWPQNKTLDSLGLLNVANTTAGANPISADEIYLKNSPASWGMKNAFLKSDGKWYLSANPTVPADFGFNIPNGYYYSLKKTSATVNWERTYSDN
ncbi:hypothetical protein A3K48_04810 [candidate division WOR-1 bacterium RIFOXYA12_FULL_52_29]|uniref:Uncharacterized protein n=1 Tax=candidate division WOR-1 bacterium RIFOXYC12_FULL_54_18 TaxID=1802584 RepID=A0A1F4T6A3_UNCSA|nr:MAG: hypothetical protein A3K44_04810 [candidate division WOR-1 bacterium RIFOXYA2_FULL_51_19]OGC17868.1 MAG: hypothetical protein A3K48_04810 [candidate division WOR-1 bacterium RIFOXYA12_FULL_52_29]OGC26725.1 MAG: hypothetical protein A3K32_04805 [candidate division WOR-1 bacterium RIFOXYB2_FULL_45_9]OGC28285.1 MAG: hypothetical protein A3K49_04810 [candidate division WOR-1 bacterium RIFOXYC12_FULL_54_18]OGC31257.1 MAG: hypothetical protein A2346_07810 [candidate division WOR-1 bacterium R